MAMQGGPAADAARSAKCGQRFDQTSSQAAPDLPLRCRASTREMNGALASV